MYVIKVMHGYIDVNGRRTRDKSHDKLMLFLDREHCEQLADQVGGRVKKLDHVDPNYSTTLV